MTGYVLGGQINLQKGQLGATNLMDHLRSHLHTCSQPSTDNNVGPSKSFLICVQEPPVREGKIICFDQTHNLIYDRQTDRPRAGIYASRDMNIWPMPEFTIGDMATGLWKTGDEDIKEVIVTSVYMDITLTTVWPPLLEKLLDYCRIRHKEVLICADTNGHSSLWNCEDTNQRGERIEDLIFTHGLQVCNVGDHFTFYNKRSSTIIDVTLSSPRLGDSIRHWKVNPAVQGSDHLLADFEITISSHKTRKSRNYKLGDWNLFQELMEHKTPHIPEYWTHQHLEMEVDQLVKDIHDSLDKSHPPKVVRNTFRPLRWWSGELSELKKQTKIAFSVHRRERTDESYDNLKSARRNLWKAVRRAKRKSWQKFCLDAVDPGKVAIVNKTVQKRDNHVLGMLSKGDGSMCKSPEESIDELAKAHFPGSVTVNPCNESVNERCHVKNTMADFITLEKIQESIRSFGDFKAPGPDMLPPIIYKKLGPRALERLRAIFKASYLLGYLPKLWRKGKVIFIPKQGKKDYANPRSFRPITLSCFMIKILERILLWQLQETVLKEKPLSKNQHAFRKGRSTESALSCMVSHIEGAIDKKEYALGVFLDIQGAFDNVKPEAIIRGLKARGVPDELLKWYDGYLRTRSIVIDHLGVKIILYLTLGVPQGGVLSPLMWNLAFEGLLELFEDGFIKISGFADDAGLLTTGKVPSVMASRMQKAINKALEWGNEAGLTFSAQKNRGSLIYKTTEIYYASGIKDGRQPNSLL